jgi:hypothetical protein
MTKTVKLDLGDERGTIWIEVFEVEQEARQGRTAAFVKEEVVTKLANVFEQIRHVFEIAESQLSLMREAADETTLEIGAKISANGKLVIVEGSAEGSIKITMKWQKPKPNGTTGSA